MGDFHMLIALALLAAVALAALALLHTQGRQHAQQQVDWASERRELLERIQRPELIPAVRDAEPFELPEQKPDEWARVGQIDIDDKYGLEDDG